MVVAPHTVEEIAQWVAETPKIALPSSQGWGAPISPDAVEIDLSPYSGILDFPVKDQIVKVRAGMSPGDLQKELAAEGYCLPTLFPDLQPGKAPFEPLARAQTLAEAVAFGLPHAREYQTGSWREWLIGTTVITGDGEIVKLGSSVVKNVAGYDIQRLMIGSRMSLGLIVEVTLRVFPIPALPESSLIVVREGEPGAIRRVLDSDFEEEVTKPGVLAHDRASETLWLESGEGESPKDSWTIRKGTGVFEDDPVAKWMHRAKEKFDPHAKFNPGVWGIF
jgi:glycolate oxidase FAD binding subunit